MHLISKKLDYALRALTFMATMTDRKIVLAREIARCQQVPMRFLQKIMKDLVDQRLVRSYQGPGGGYALAKKPAEITLRDVMEAVEGPIGLIECTEGDPGCGMYGNCPQVTSWQDLHRRFLKMLAEKRLTDLSGAYTKPVSLPTL
ncbi:MAG: Rrf2 family transcriptional regulator [Pseudomonadota bacterium]